MASDTAIRSKLSRYAENLTTVADEAIVIDLDQFTANPGKHWVVWNLTLIALLTARAPDTRGVPPITGLFLCPPGTPKETTAQLATSWNPLARPIPIELNDPYLNSAIVGTGYALQMVAALAKPLTVPYGYFLRAMVVCQAASGTPGPGAASYAEFTALMFQEDDGDC